MIAITTMTSLTNMNSHPGTTSTGQRKRWKKRFKREIEQRKLHSKGGHERVCAPLKLEQSAVLRSQTKVDVVRLGGPWDAANSAGERVIDSAMLLGGVQDAVWSDDGQASYPTKFLEGVAPDDSVCGDSFFVENPVEGTSAGLPLLPSHAQ